MIKQRGKNERSNCWELDPGMLLHPPATGLYTIATAHTIHHKLHHNITNELQNIYFIHTEDRKLTIANIKSTCTLQRHK